MNQPLTNQSKPAISNQLGEVSLANDRIITVSFHHNTIGSDSDSQSQLAELLGLSDPDSGAGARKSGSALDQAILLSASNRTSEISNSSPPPSIIIDFTGIENLGAESINAMNAAKQKASQFAINFSAQHIAGSAKEAAPMIDLAAHLSHQVETEHGAGR